MTLKECKALFAYDRWATNRLLETVATLTEDQYRKDLGSSFGGVRGTLVHIYGADWIWLQRWKGNHPSVLTKEEEIPTLPMLKQRWEDLRTELEGFLGSLTEEKLQAPLNYKDTKGVPYSLPLYQQLQHRINHSTYHRGQVVTFLRQLGAKPQSSDLILFYRETVAKAKAAE
jgi:uncharacterized damage-inducible protein DinB